MNYLQVTDIHPRIKEAIEKNLPVVALESTIITHGNIFKNKEWNTPGIWHVNNELAVDYEYALV